MNLDEIRNSGLLELYVIGSIDSDDLKIVEECLGLYPELKEDLKEIESALFHYAQIHGSNPSQEVRSELLNSIKDSTKMSSDNSKSNILKLLSLGLFISTIIISFLYFQNRQTLSALEKEYDQEIIRCDSLENVNAGPMAILNDLKNRNNIIFEVESTSNYPETDLYFYNNEVDGKSYLKIHNLPNLEANQSFQLCSLKSNVNPIPLDVFESNVDAIIEVQHVEASNAYAITIEPKGGSTSPTLSNLIGVFNISS